MRRREEKEAANAKARARRQLLVDKYERLVERCRREGTQPPTLQAYLDSNGKVKRAGQTLEDVRAEEEKKKPSAEERARSAIKRLLEYTAGGDGLRSLKTCRILINNALEVRGGLAARAVGARPNPAPWAWRRKTTPSTAP